MPNLYFFHGLESSPQGNKARCLEKHFPECQTPLLPNGIEERLQILEKLIQEECYLVGSSLGGLSALMFSMGKPELVKGMVLLAPAVGFYDPKYRNPQLLELVQGIYIPENIPTVVLAGNLDRVIPLEDIESMIRRSPSQKEITFIKIDDDHRLGNSFPEMINAIETIMGIKHP